MTRTSYLPEAPHATGLQRAPLRRHADRRARARHRRDGAGRPGVEHGRATSRATRLPARRATTTCCRRRPSTEMATPQSGVRRRRAGRCARARASSWCAAGRGCWSATPARCPASWPGCSWTGPPYRRGGARQRARPGCAARGCPVDLLDDAGGLGGAPCRRRGAERTTCRPRSRRSSASGTGATPPFVLRVGRRRGRGRKPVAAASRRTGSGRARTAAFVGTSGYHHGERLHVVRDDGRRRQPPGVRDVRLHPHAVRPRRADPRPSLERLADRGHVEVRDPQRRHRGPGEVVAPLAGQRRAGAPDAAMTRPSRSTGDSLNRKLFTAPVDLAVLDQVDAVAGQPGEQQRLRVDLADVPEAGQQQPALGRRRPSSSSAAGRAVDLEDQVVDAGVDRLAGQLGRVPGLRAAPSARRPRSSRSRVERQAVVEDRRVVAGRRARRRTARHSSPASAGSLRSVSGRSASRSPIRVPPPRLGEHRAALVGVAGRRVQYR